MNLRGRVINGGSASGEAIVLDTPFSFIGDFDPDTGKVTIPGHPLFGKSLANKILVCPTGKGGTIAPFIAYEGWEKGNTPAAILCRKVDPVLCESALAINIPLVDSFEAKSFERITTGRFITIENDQVVVKE